MPLPRWLMLLQLAVMPVLAEPTGASLEARAGAAVLAADAEYGRFPISADLWCRLTSTDRYSILIAHGPKSSPTHWELFCTPGDGVLSAYLPGFAPDTPRTSVNLVDGRWHRVSMVLEPDRLRLWVDGRPVLDQPLRPPSGAGPPGELALGALVDNALGCAGWVDEVRLARGVITPEVPMPAEALLGSWSFEPPTPGLNAAGPGRRAVIRPSGYVVTTDNEEIPGGMPTAFQPLPEPVDAAPLRAAVERVARRLGLRSVDLEPVSDAVLREWDYDFTWIGRLEYPEARPGGADPAAVEAQVFDRAALVHPSDGGPLGTVLRRTEALAALLAGQLDPAAASADLASLRAAAAGLANTSPEYRELYLAACAVRRALALRNPLLDFDSLVCAARGTFAGSVRSNPATTDVQGGHFVTQYFGFNALPGGGLLVVRNLKGRPELVNLLADSRVTNGRLRGRRLDHGAFATPDLSLDGRKVVFAWTANREHQWIYGRDTAWHLFSVNTDGGGLTQLTDGPDSDFDPCWLPNGRIAFCSERRGGYIRCFAAYLKVRNYTLFSMTADGGDIRPMSYYETSEWDPSVNHAGQLVYTRWDYTDRENCLGSRIWLARPDGTDPRAPHGNYPLPFTTLPGYQPWRFAADGRELDSRMGAPLVEMGLRQVPGSQKYLFTAAPHHGEVFGSLCLLDLRQPDDGHMSQIRRLTPEEPFPETETAGRRHYKYGTPWPLSEDLYLSTVWENVCLVDRFGNKELLADLRSAPCPPDERLRLTCPIPLRPRARPPIIPARTRPDRPATVAIMNVYDSDLPFPPGVRIKWLRVTQNILKTNHAMGEPMIGYERENTPRVPLGIVPVEDDGSVYFEAPPAKELIFQVLDEQFRAVQSMRSTAFLQPGEQLACQGCHEPPGYTPKRARPPRALSREPSQLQPELGAIEPISYYRQIKPIVDQRCVPCHAAGGRGPTDLGYEALREDAFWFSGAMYTQMIGPYSGVHGGSRSIPGRFGARNCRLGRAIFDDTHRDVVSDADRRALTLWLDSNSLRLGSYIREGAQLRGELVWPTLDVDPANPLGLRGTGPALRGWFWHQNTHGPYAHLVTSHTLDEARLIAADGTVLARVPAAHPQDVWRLDDGSILLATTHAARRIGPDGGEQWSYRVDPPNEIPTVQPLPDGGTLVGIVGECRLVELDAAGAVRHLVPLRTSVAEPHAQFRFCRKTPEGTYLVPFTADGVVRELAADGTVLREFPRLDSPVAAVRLEDGHTLITAGRRVTEYDPADRVVWQLRPSDVPDLNLATLAGVTRLPNGNTVVCNWNAHDSDGRLGAHIFEVTNDKRVVWTVSGDTLGQVAQIHLLDAKLRPLAGWR